LTDGTHIHKGKYKEMEVFTLEEQKKLVQESYCISFVREKENCSKGHRFV